MTVLPPSRAPLTTELALGALADLGFLARPDLPDRPGPAYLLVAIRDTPTLRHFDPETIEYWVGEAGRGTRRTLDRDTPMPLEVDLSWGQIQIVDRFKVTNEYLTFGGRLSAATVGDTTVVVITSPAPILRRGGHSQRWDQGAENLGAFFARLLLAVDYTKGFETRVAEAAPLVRYAAFLIDVVHRYRASQTLRASEPELWVLLDAAERRLRADHPTEWTLGAALLDDAQFDEI
jgi:hypothetical protein